MTRWRSESERWQKACNSVEAELRSARDLIDVVRAYFRKKSCQDEFLEFLLAARLGEKEAAKLLAEIKLKREAA